MDAIACEATRLLLFIKNEKEAGNALETRFRTRWHTGAGQIMTRVPKSAVRLRPHVKSDKADFIAVPRDPEFYRLLGCDLPHQWSREDEAQVWYERKTHPEHSWAIEVDGRCVGSVWIHSIETENRRARFAIEIFDARYWNRGVGPTATGAVVDFAFEKLRLHRLDLRVLTANERAIRCYERCGFVREGVQRDILFLGGRWYSDLWMSILESEYIERSAKSASHAQTPEQGANALSINKNDPRH